MAYGPWKLLRSILRVVLFTVLVWFVLALLWAFLPSPSLDGDPANGRHHATSQLRAGKTLTRVYELVPPVQFSCAAKANCAILPALTTSLSSTAVDKASQ
jgi:hypothetical protein